MYIQVRKVHCCLPISSVFKPINEKLHVGGTFGDLAKYCDSMQHKILLPKLHFYGI